MRTFSYPPSRAHAERIIAAARVVLAASALFAVWLDPAEPARFERATYAVHVGYLTYSLGVTALVWARPLGPQLAIVTHVVDILLFSVFQYLTLGPSSPFFIYFIFSMFCGAIRWGWQGALVTSGIVTAAYLMMGGWMSRTLGPSEFELNRFIIRTVYLLVAGALLVYLGRHESRLRGEIERLARWPATSGVDTAVIRTIIEYAAHILEARRAIVVWEAVEEPDLHVATWSDEGYSLTRHPPDAPPPPLPADGDDAVAASFKTERVDGRVVFTDLGMRTEELSHLTEVVAREIGASLDQIHVAQQLTQIAAGEERIRVARDLHDGVLQSLTGIRLELRAAATSPDGLPASARDRLFAIERALAIEQRELRLFIGGLRPSVGPNGRTPPLASRLESLRERIALEWKAPVAINIVTDPPALPEELEHAVPLMVHEAIVNALKHGAPSHVAVTLDSSPGELHIAVVDDGHGFPFRGRFDHAALITMNAGPRSLLDRITSLGGRMTIESTDTGSRVELTLAV